MRSPATNIGSFQEANLNLHMSKEIDSTQFDSAGEEDVPQSKKMHSKCNEAPRTVGEG